MVHKYNDPEPAAWDRFIAAQDKGQELEIDEAMYSYWLEVLPPVFMYRSVRFPDPQRPTLYDFGFAEGTEAITLFWRSKDGKRYYCRRSTLINRAG